jgi:hypothetical protein
MSPPEVWGPAVWTLFHTLAEKVTDEAYPFVKGQLFGQIRRICGFLPCPECSADATNFLAKVNIADLKTKIDFRNTFYLFHNMVNAKKRKPLFNYSLISSYNNYGIVPVINNFISKYNTKGNMKLIAESFQRKLVLGEFKSWFTKTIRAFTPPQSIPHPISEITIEESTVTTEDATDVVCCGRHVSTKEHIVTEEVVSEATVTEEVTSQNPITEEVVSEATVTEEVTSQNPITEEVVSKVTVTEEVVSDATVTEEVVSDATVTEEVVATEEVVSEATVTEEVVATEEVVSTEEVVATEEVVVTEEIATEEVLSEATVIEEVVSEATVAEEVVQPKSKKGRKPKK